LEVMMIAGGAMVFIGVIAGVLCYAVYSAGRQEYISHGIDGTTYNPAQAPGEPGRRAMAYVGFTVAGLGAVLVLLSVTAYLIGGRLRRPAGKAS
jgi:hypothetical protein